ncbi:MAG: cobalamin-binding protein [Cyanobacteria bacterium J06638_22]
MEQRRIVSLLPSATEIVDFLGLSRELVGRSHECDFPAEVQHLPICTEPKLDPQGSSREIHQRVMEILRSALSVYRVHVDVLQQLQPTHIVTQAQCEVCAVSLGEVEQAAVELTNCHPHIISLQPGNLAEVWADIERVAEVLNVAAPMDAIHHRVQACQALSERAIARPTVGCIEWIDPLMAAGNWVPELVEMAGGVSCFGTAGEHSPWLNWDDLRAADPDVLVLMPCGFDLERTLQESKTLVQHPAWPTLKAVKTGHVYVTDGNQYFNRPGPRLVDSLEILTEILQPELFHETFAYSYEGAGWRSLALVNAAD